MVQGNGLYHVWHFDAACFSAGGAAGVVHDRPCSVELGEYLCVHPAV